VKPVQRASKDVKMEISNNSSSFISPIQTITKSVLKHAKTRRCLRAPPLPNVLARRIIAVHIIALQLNGIDIKLNSGI